MKSTEKNAHNQRRKFLDMIAKAGISSAVLRASPLVAGLMVNRFAYAANPPKRAFFAFFPGGMPGNNWMPDNLSTMKTATMPLAPYASMCQFSAINMGGGGHGGANWALGGNGNRGSIDFHLGKAMPGLHATLPLGAGTDTNDLIGITAGGGKIQPYTDPLTALNLMFKPGQVDASAAATYAKNKSVMDANIAAINAIKNKLGAEEQLRLQAHAEAIQAVENRMQKETESVPLEGCKVAPAIASSEYSAIGRLMQMHVDVGIAAMQCGLTNVVSLQMSTTQCNWKLETPTQTIASHHEAIHGGGDQTACVTFQSAQAAYILKRLSTTKDALTGAMLIDSTVYLQTCDFGDGAGHSTNGAPSIIATKMPGFGTPGTKGGGSLFDSLRKVATGLGFADVAAKYT